MYKCRTEFHITIRNWIPYYIIGLIMGTFYYLRYWLEASFLQYTYVLQGAHSAVENSNLTIKRLLILRLSVAHP